MTEGPGLPERGAPHADPAFAARRAWAMSYGMRPPLQEAVFGGRLTGKNTCGGLLFRAGRDP